MAAQRQTKSCFCCGSYTFYCKASPNCPVRVWTVFWLERCSDRSKFQGSPFLLNVWFAGIVKEGEAGLSVGWTSLPVLPWSDQSLFCPAHQQLQPFYRLLQRQLRHVGTCTQNVRSSISSWSLWLVLFKLLHLILTPLTRGFTCMWNVHIYYWKCSLAADNCLQVLYWFIFFCNIIDVFMLILCSEMQIKLHS